MQCSSDSAEEAEPTPLTVGTSGSEPCGKIGDTSLYFVQWCPTCGRALRTLVSLLGKQVACHHCRSVFLASADEGAGNAPVPPSNLQRAEQLLAQLEPRFG